jgi:hypothetical protein
MVTGLEIHRREVLLDGKPFGDAGAYEKIVGRLSYAVDPEHPLHRQIADIALAPTNAEGRVEFSGDFYLLRPVDARKGNKRLLFDVPNRGRKSTISLFNSTARSADPITAHEFGNGFLLRQGYTLAWAGWQADIERHPGFMALGGRRRTSSSRRGMFSPKTSRQPWSARASAGTGFSRSSPADSQAYFESASSG